MKSNGLGSFTKKGLAMEIPHEGGKGEASWKRGGERREDGGVSPCMGEEILQWGRGKESIVFKRNAGDFVERRT